MLSSICDKLCPASRKCDILWYQSGGYILKFDIGLGLRAMRHCRLIYTKCHIEVLQNESREVKLTDLKSDIKLDLDTIQFDIEIDP